MNEQVDWLRAQKACEPLGMTQTHGAATADVCRCLPCYDDSLGTLKSGSPEETE